MGLGARSYNLHSPEFSRYTNTLHILIRKQALVRDTKRSHTLIFASPPTHTPQWAHAQARMPAWVRKRRSSSLGEGNAMLAGRLG